MIAIEQKQLKKELFKLQMKVVKLKAEISYLKSDKEAVLKDKAEELEKAKEESNFWYKEFVKLKESTNTDTVNEVMKLKQSGEALLRLKQDEKTALVNA